MVLWECPGGLVVRIQRFHQCGPGSIPGLGIEIKPLHTAIPRPPPPNKVFWGNIGRFIPLRNVYICFLKEQLATCPLAPSSGDHRSRNTATTPQRSPFLGLSFAPCLAPCRIPVSRSRASRAQISQVMPPRLSPPLPDPLPPTAHPPPFPTTTRRAMEAARHL